MELRETKWKHFNHSTEFSEMSGHCNWFLVVRRTRQDCNTFHDFKVKRTNILMWLNFLKENHPFYANEYDWWYYIWNKKNYLQLCWLKWTIIRVQWYLYRQCRFNLINVLGKEIRHSLSHSVSFVPAWAITIHKSQGLNITTSCNKSWKQGVCTRLTFIFVSKVRWIYYKIMNLL